MMLKARLPAAQRSTRGMVCKAQLSMPQRVGTAAAASLVSAGGFDAGFRPPIPLDATLASAAQCICVHMS